MIEGDAIPDVSVTTPDGASLALPSLAGKPLVVYFYPKDDTPGCTTEAKDFSALKAGFAAVGVGVLGLSKDDPAAHAKFTTKHALSVPLASDESGAACEAFGVWVEKNMYGKKYMGIERATFLFDATGHLVHAWRKVKVPGHAAAVLEVAKTLQD